MELYLQTGSFMQAHSLELVKKWGKGTVIFSPNHMTKEVMLREAKKLSKVNGKIIVDPQFYVPRTSQEKLKEQSFWPKDYDTNLFFSKLGVDKMINSLIDEYIIPIKASKFIIPTLYMSSFDDDWMNTTEILINSCKKRTLSIESLLTLCIDDKLLSSEETIHEIIDNLEDFPVDGFYIIPKHPNDKYLVDEITWMTNLLDLVAGLKLKKKKVIIGYSNHQFLLFALAKVDAICSGIWIKNRSFPLSDFDEEDNDNKGGGKRKPWYYCPQALSEYQLDFLSRAQSIGILDNLKSPEKYLNNYSNILFSGADPATVNFSEREAFRHYLHCLKLQCEEFSKSTYKETKSHLKLAFDTANDLTSFFRGRGIRGKYRDFNDVAETNLAAIDIFDNLRGLIYQTNWNKI